MEWLKPAMVYMALASIVLAATFFYVWARFIRRRYVLLWALAWLAAVPHIVFSVRLLEHPTSETDWVAQQLFLLLNALLMMGGCFEFVQRRFPVRLVAALAVPSLLWMCLAPLMTERFFEITLPNSLLLGISYLGTATLFFRRRAHLGKRGARLTAALFALAGIHELDFPLFGDVAWAAPMGYSLAAVLANAISLSLLIMILEESRDGAERERALVRAILDHLPVGVLVTSPTGQVILANPLARRLTGSLLEAKPESMLPDIETEVFRHPDGTRCLAEELPIAEALRTGASTEAREYAMSLGDGSRCAALVNAGPVRDEQGGLVGAVAVFQEIDELKKMQAEVTRSERLKGLGTLAAGVAHDFNNALTMILGHAELAAASAKDAKAREQLGVIAGIATDSAAIARRLQDVARTRSTRKNSVFDLAAVVREAVDITRPRWRDEAQARGLAYDVRTELAADGTINGQPAELREVLINMIFNAIDAMPAGGSLKLGVVRHEGEVMLTITDTGGGMSPEVRERIFDPFFSTKGSRGTGLGLSIVFGIVERHEGRIEVVSQIGRGTTFALHFPHAIPERTEAVAPAATTSPPRLRVLAVDDEPIVASLVAALLEPAGHQVTTATSGAQAVDLVGRQTFDLVLTDLGMPDMNGWDVAAAVRALKPGLPVVLVTGWGDAVTSEQARSAGVCFVLCKPFNRAQLSACVATVAEQMVPVPA